GSERDLGAAEVERYSTAVGGLRRAAIGMPIGVAIGVPVGSPDGGQVTQLDPLSARSGFKTLASERSGFGLGDGGAGLGLIARILWRRGDRIGGRRRRISERIGSEAGGR